MFNKLSFVLQSTVPVLLLIAKVAAAGMTKRTASEDVVEPLQKRQRPSFFRSQSLTSRSESRASRHSPNLRRSQRLSSPPQLPSATVRSASARLHEPLTLVVSDSEQPQYKCFNEDNDPLLYRILTGLEYTRAQNASGERVMQTTRFFLRKRDHRHPGSALEVLRQARREGHANRIAMSYYDEDIVEIWEIGVPRPDWVTEGAIGSLHDPQWFHGKDAAEVKAGPYATEPDVKKARANLKRQATRQANRVTRTDRDIEIDRKLTEGMRRQELGLRMGDGDDGIEQSVSNPETRLSVPSVSNSRFNDFSNSDDEPLMQRCQRMRAAATTQKVPPTVHPPSASSRRQYVASSESDTYVPSSSSASSFEDGNSEDDERPRNKGCRPSRILMQKRLCRIDGRRRSIIEQNSESEDGLPVKRGVRHRLVRTMRDKGPPEAEESSSDEVDDGPAMRHSGRKPKVTASRRHRPIITESSESE